jgi:hypothetical protein
VSCARTAEWLSRQAGPIRPRRQENLAGPLPLKGSAGSR